MYCFMASCKIVNIEQFGEFYFDGVICVMNINLTAPFGDLDAQR